MKRFGENHNPAKIKALNHFSVWNPSPRNFLKVLERGEKSRKNKGKLKNYKISKGYPALA